MTGQALRPTVLWAQRPEGVWLTVDIKDAQDVKVDLKAESLNFSAKGKDDKMYEFDMEFSAPVKVEESKHKVTRSVELFLKKETEESWVSPLKKGVKNWIQVDWHKWVDSDDEGDDKGDFNQEGMSGMGGMPGMGGMGGMPGMGGMGGMPGMGGMGGMPGMGGMGGGDFDMAKLMEQMKSSGMGGMGGDEEGDSDDELADLDEKAAIDENTDAAAAIDEKTDAAAEEVTAPKEAAVDASVESTTPA